MSIQEMRNRNAVNFSADPSCRLVQTLLIFLDKNETRTFLPILCEGLISSPCGFLWNSPRVHLHRPSGCTEDTRCHGKLPEHSSCVHCRRTLGEESGSGSAVSPCCRLKELCCCWCTVLPVDQVTRPRPLSSSPSVTRMLHFFPLEWFLRHKEILWGL